MRGNAEQEKLSHSTFQVKQLKIKVLTENVNLQFSRRVETLNQSANMMPVIIIMFQGNDNKKGVNAIMVQNII